MEIEIKKAASGLSKLDATSLSGMSENDFINYLTKLNS